MGGRDVKLEGAGSDRVTDLSPKLLKLGIDDDSVEIDSYENIVVDHESDIIVVDRSMVVVD